LSDSTSGSDADGSYDQFNGQISIRNGTYQWTLSGSGTSEYYLELNGGGDPSIANFSTSGAVYEDGEALVEGTAGSLTAGQTDYADNDTLGFSTVYVRLSDSTDPDTKAVDFVELGYQSATNQIDLPNQRIQDVLFRVLLKGTRPKQVRVDYYTSGGSFISSSVVSPFGSAADGRDSVDAGWFCISRTEDSIPATAAKYRLAFYDLYGENSKIYSVETRMLTEIAGAGKLPGYAALPYKGFGSNKINGRFNWFNPGTSGGQGGTLTFKEVYDYLRASKITYQANGYRVTVGIDDGFANVPYAGSYDATSTRNLRMVLSACELLNLRFVPVLIYAPNTGTESQFPDTDMMVNSTIRDTYVEAIKDFVTECELWNCVVAYDPVSEVNFGLADDRAGTEYTQTQILDVWNVYSDAIREITKKPVILSMADGFEGQMAMTEMDFTKIDILDAHCYNRGWRYASVRHFPKGFIGASLEIGRQDGVASATVQANEIEAGLADASEIACACWAWAPQFDDEGSTVSNAEALERYNSW
jgi:hypothetical protein